MFSIVKELKEYLNALNKKQLGELVKIYHELCECHDATYEKDIEKKKKADIIKYLLDNKINYIKYFIMLLDKVDYLALKEMIHTNKKDESNNKAFIDNCIQKRIIFKNKELEIPIDIYDEIKRIVNNKEVVAAINKQEKLYKYADGIIIAYGVVEKSIFEKYLRPIEEKWEAKLNFYYKKEYLINEKKIVSKNLKNKDRISRYIKNKDLKPFNEKEFLLLGNQLYHHTIKSYKKFIKVLKSNYVFKKSDIDFIDKELVTPYLYKSLNEESIANQKLEETIKDLFEFKNDKLKNKMIEEVKKVKNDFPIWEYRGFSKNEVK